MPAILAPLVNLIQMLHVGSDEDASPGLRLCALILVIILGWLTVRALLKRHA